MRKLTKAQQKRMVQDILKKSGKLFLTFGGGSAARNSLPVLTSKDYSAIERICKAAMKRIG